MGSRRILWIRLLLVVPLLAAGLALRPSRAAAATVCDTGGSGVRSGVIKDSVVVRSGTTCNLEGAVVRGGVTVEPGAELVAYQGTEIRGSVSATAPAAVGIFVSVVRGSVTVTGGVASGRSIRIQDNDIRGDVVLTGVTVDAADIQVGNNDVRGSVILRQNSFTTFGEIYVFANEIGANLDCADNSPDPSLDGNTANTVAGAKLGECAGL